MRWNIHHLQRSHPLRCHFQPGLGASIYYRSMIHKKTKASGIARLWKNYSSQASLFAQHDLYLNNSPVFSPHRKTTISHTKSHIVSVTGTSEEQSICRELSIGLLITSSLSHWRIPGGSGQDSFMIPVLEAQNHPSHVQLSFGQLGTIFLFPW